MARNPELKVQIPITSSPETADTGNSPGNMANLPRNSPLNNIIHSASLEEEMIQTKIKYRLAESQLIQEKARRGYASKEVVARVQALSGKLAAMNKRRSEIGNDVYRMDAFRRDDANASRLRDEDMKSIGSKIPPFSTASNEWKSRLTLCYEALERTEPWYETVKRVKSESGTLSGEAEPTIKQESTDEQEMLGVNGVEDGKLATPSQCLVRFALTDVETLL